LKKIIIVLAVVLFVFGAIAGGIIQMPHINQKKCIRCGVCKLACPNKAIDLIVKGKKEIYIINVAKCKIDCGQCIKACPNKVISYFPIDTAYALEKKDREWVETLK
jgi:formate hydrogenlyase subunit 6/NADH:ubiquinone oxidoreductase subunit I